MWAGALAALLLLLHAGAPEAAQPPAPNGTVAQLWSWWVAGGGALPEGGSDAMRCLAEAFSGAPRDRKVFSQFGEDGIIEAVFDCIGSRDKYYVEFGTQDASECTTRYLRTKGWSGLLMDGSHENATINLHKEYMRSDNIAGLFHKYDVPYPTFDHLTADIDLNTFWVLRAVLAAGYTPRSIAVEYNRNFAPAQSYAAIDMPSESWAWSCYYAASGRAYERLLRAFGYSLVAFDHAGVNLFFVRDKELGAPLPHSFAEVTPDAKLPAWQPMHGDCRHQAWLRIGGGRGIATARWLRGAAPVVLGNRAGAGGRRELYEVESPDVLAVHRDWRHGGGPGGGGGGAGEHARRP